MFARTVRSHLLRILLALSHPFALDGGTRVTKAQHG